MPLLQPKPTERHHPSGLKVQRPYGPRCIAQPEQAVAPSKCIFTDFEHKPTDFVIPASAKQIPKLVAMH
jgi:hypothetical protein